MRVRKALMNLTDRAALVEALQDGEGGVAHAFISPLVAYYPEVERAVTKYPFDPSRAEQLLTEAGLSRNRDGQYVTANGAMFSPQLRTVSANTGSLDEREQAMLVDLWRRAGIQVEPAVLPVAQANDGQALSTFPALNNGSTAIASTFPKFDGKNVAAPENRWTRSNRNGWTNAEYDRLMNLFDRTLDLREAQGIRVQMLKILSEEVPGLPLYNSAGVTGYAKGLEGPVLGGSTWNIHEWQWR
jgi:peptide/nickel transport system substrate-binding protein